MFASKERLDSNWKHPNKMWILERSLGCPRRHREETMSPFTVCDDRIVPSASTKNRAARIFHALTRPVAILHWCAALAMCSTTGCLHPKIGPQSLPIDRAAYSASLSDSWKEQALLNI